MPVLLISLAVCSITLVMLVLGIITLVRCRREDIPDIVQGMGGWFQSPPTS